MSDGYQPWGTIDDRIRAEESRAARERAAESAHENAAVDQAPHNHEAEAALLGALMVDNRMVDEVPGLLPEHFHDPFHQYIYATIQTWRSEGRLANPVTLRDVVGGGDPTGQARSASYLADLTGSGVALIGARDFAQQITELFDLRKVREIAAKAIERCAAGEVELDAHAIAADMENEISESLAKPMKRHTVSFAQAFDDVTDEYKSIESGAPPPGFTIDRYNDWNVVCGRMEPQDLILLGGRPSMGKSGVAAAVALGAAEAGIGTDILSLEMDRRKMARRIIAELLYDTDDPIPYEDLVAGKMSMARWRRFSEARDRIADLPLTISDPPVMYVEDVGPHIRRRKREFEKRGQKLGLSILDYLGRLETRRKMQGTTESVTYISRTLKAAAKENDVAMVALAQLSRGLEARENKRPMLADLRDSGSLEQDADIVVFVYREEYYLERLEPKRSTEKWQQWTEELASVRGDMEIYSAKKREGALTKRVSKFLTKYQAVLDSNDPRVVGDVGLFEEMGFPEVRS